MERRYIISIFVSINTTVEVVVSRHAYVRVTSITVSGRTVFGLIRTVIGIRFCRRKYAYALIIEEKLSFRYRP